jgi:hypothetical protein
VSLDALENDPGRRFPLCSGTVSPGPIGTSVLTFVASWVVVSGSLIMLLPIKLVAAGASA